MTNIDAQLSIERQDLEEISCEILNSLLGSDADFSPHDTSGAETIAATVEILGEALRELANVIGGALKPFLAAPATLGLPIDTNLDDASGEQAHVETPFGIFTVVFHE